MATILSQRSSNLSTFNAIAINYSTLSGSTITNASTLTTSSITYTSILSHTLVTSTLTLNSTMVSLGQSTNQTLSGTYGNSVAIGSQAGASGQLLNAVAIGSQAGQTNQGQNSVAIGYLAGQTNQAASTIILNASGTALNATIPGFFVSTIASYTTSSASMSLLAYGTDNQIAQTTNAITLLSSGYVGIGTTNPTSALQVIGNIAGTTKTFDIPHPLYPNTNKRLVHSAIEGPRCDLIYRGTTVLNNGIATVYIDTQCTYDPTCAMEQGTFTALCTNPQFFLQNMTGFDQVIGSIQGTILTITCQNTSSMDTINWMVVAERADSFIKQWDRTNANGYLITQYST